MVLNRYSLSGGSFRGPPAREANWRCARGVIYTAERGVSSDEIAAKWDDDVARFRCGGLTISSQKPGPSARPIECGCRRRLDEILAVAEETRPAP